MSDLPLVVFGSSVRWTGGLKAPSGLALSAAHLDALAGFADQVAQAPRDIDVACCSYKGLEKEDVLRVRRWAAERGLPADLPIDTHCIGHTGYRYLGGEPVPTYVRLPIMCGRRCDFAVLPGSSVEVHWVSYSSVAAVLRTYGDDINAAVLMWKELGRQWGGAGHSRCIDIGGAAEEAGPEHDWSAYVGGLRALRSSIVHAPRWREIFARMPEGEFLAALLERGPSAAGVELAKKGSSGNGARLFFDEAGVTRQYPRERHSYPQAIDLFVAR